MPEMTLDIFRKSVGDLVSNSDVLEIVKQEYFKLEGYPRGSVERLSHAVMVYTGCPTTLDWRSIKHIQADLHNALDNPSVNEEWIQLHETLCSKLEPNFHYTFPYLSYEPSDNGVKEELSKCGFLMRGRSTRTTTTINEGLERDKERFTQFMESEHNSIIQTLFDDQVSASLEYKKGLKTPEQLRGLFNSARLVHTPPNTEVIIYYAGHGQEDSGNWVVCDPNKAAGSRLCEIGLEEVLDVWISRPEEAKALCLTILADCCCSGHWARKLEEAKKYDEYPICIISACGEDEEAREDDLVCRLQGQTPEDPDRQHPQWWATPQAIKFNPLLYNSFKENVETSLLNTCPC